MNGQYDAIVVGLGGMGSAALYQLAKRGARVLGLDQFAVPHSLGSSHGLTRIIRLAYYEDLSYVPLLRRAYERWRRLEQDAGEPLLHITGGLDIGAADSGLIRGSLAACAAHDIEHELLTATEAMARFPALQLPPHFVASYQADAGFLMSERCVVAHVMRAQALGASRAVGLMTRPERVIVLALGLLTGYLTVAVAVIAVLAPLTAVHRLVYGYATLRKGGGG